MNDRDGFEIFIRKNYFFGYPGAEKIDIDIEDGGYIDSVVHGAWLVWSRLEYRTCCEHPDCTTCAGRGGFYRIGK